MRGLTARRRRSPRPAVTFVIAGLISLTLSVPAGAEFESVADLFKESAWDRARALADGTHSTARPAESELWRSRLAADPAAALELLQEGRALKRLGKPVQARLALEIADLELGRGKPAEALAALSPLLDQGGDLPGLIQVTAARALFALGRGPRARELLASVRQDDAAYAVSRALMGDIAIAQGDGVQALRWYDAADQEDPELRRRTVAGRCRALLLAGRLGDVQALAARIETLDPGSLALMEIKRAVREHREEETTRQPDRAASSPPGKAANEPTREALNATLESPSDSPPPVSGNAAGGEQARYTLQLGAFADRGRALDFLRRHEDKGAGLIIEEGSDGRGQVVYRIRAGAWSEADAAEEAARDLGRRLGCDVIVVDRQAQARPGG